MMNAGPVAGQDCAVFDAATDDQLSEPMTRAEAGQWVKDAAGDETHGTRALAIRHVT